MRRRWPYLALVWGLHELAAQWRVPSVLRAGVAAIVLLVCLFATRAQVAWWRDGVTLFERTVAVTDDNATAHVLLGVALSDQGDRDRAVAEHEAALRIEPGHAWALESLTAEHQTLARLLLSRGDTPGATSHFAAAVRLAPDATGVRNDFANVLALQGRLGEAIEEYREALQMRADDPPTHMNLANALYLNRQVPEAMAEYREAVRLDPGYAEAHYNPGLVLDEAGQRSEAIDHFRAAVRLKPDYVEARRRLDEVSTDR